MQTAIALNRYFPQFLEMLSSLPDYRKFPDYKTEEVVMAAIALFLFKRGSRNSMDNLSRKGRFAANYKKMFGCRIPDMDTCDKLLRRVPQECLEKLKQEMVRVSQRRNQDGVCLPGIIGFLTRDGFYLVMVAGSILGWTMVFDFHLPVR